MRTPCLPIQGIVPIVQRGTWNQVMARRFDEAGDRLGLPRSHRDGAASVQWWLYFGVVFPGEAVIMPVN